MSYTKKTVAPRGTLDLGRGTRAQMYGLLLAGTMIGLPIPASVNFDNDGISLTLDRNDRAGVDVWAAFFGLEPASERDYAGQPGYSAHGHAGSAPTPWRGVRCYLDQVADKVEAETPPAADQAGA